MIQKVLDSKGFGVANLLIQLPGSDSVWNKSCEAFFGETEAVDEGAIFGAIHFSPGSTRIMGICTQWIIFFF